jgi:hypothetical protein
MVISPFMEVLALIRSPGGSAETTIVAHEALESPLHMPPRRHVKSVVHLHHTASLIQRRSSW